MENRNSFDLQKHIEQGVEAIVAETLKATLKNPKESAFMAKFAVASRKASKTRLKLEERGLHVPGFLIASITSSCWISSPMRSGCGSSGKQRSWGSASSCWPAESP